ncbi:unnamed protein product [Caenorhabditis auriculariae]|uniref:Uncharacterized protein n=1 Tax=Caenorhabditis auriculariae TaxID=2777116 RepID=A0A8S1GYK3_9PELO|nr:unnamed protein product [Caenorhabditis auriculariae]
MLRRPSQVLVRLPTRASTIWDSDDESDGYSDRTGDRNDHSSITKVCAIAGGDKRSREEEKEKPKGRKIDRKVMVHDFAISFARIEETKKKRMNVFLPTEDVTVSLTKLLTHFTGNTVDPIDFGRKFTLFAIRSILPPSRRHLFTVVRYVGRTSYEYLPLEFYSSIAEMICLLSTSEKDDQTAVSAFKTRLELDFGKMASKFFDNRRQAYRQNLAMDSLEDFYREERRRDEFCRQRCPLELVREPNEPVVPIVVPPRTPSRKSMRKTKLIKPVLEVESDAEKELDKGQDSGSDWCEGMD